jgi:DNA-binding NtrC family response regulator
MTANGAHAGPSSKPGRPPGNGRNPDIALAARSDASILLTGRPEPARRLAYRLHLASGWRYGAFTVIDCASGDPALEQSLLDALVDDRPTQPGVVLLRLVQAGTVLLQEINALPLPAQRRLAACLSDQLAWAAAGRSRRRVMASTSEPLLQRVLAGTFDDSLYYRLNVIQFFLPSAG